MFEHNIYSDSSEAKIIAAVLNPLFRIDKAIIIGIIIKNRSVTRGKNFKDVV